MIKGITACSMKQARLYNSINEREIETNRNRKQTISKIKAHNYTGCVIRKKEI